jgi:tetratricopeptide (TPR) repeat protein
LLEGARAALELGLPGLAARAAIANFRGSTSVVNAVDAERVEVLERALAAYDGQTDADAALLIATLVAEINYDTNVPMERRLDLADRAIAMARAIGEPRVLAEVLLRTARANLVPSRAALAPGLLAEAVDLADQVGDPTLAALVRNFANASYLGIGQVDRARRYLAEAVDITASGCPPLVQAMIRANTVQHLLYQGRMTEAIKTNDEFLEFAQQLGMADVDQWWAANAMVTAFLQGRIGELADAAGEFAEQLSDSITWRYSHAWMLAEAGRLSEARQVVDDHALGRPEAFAIDDLTIVAWSYLAMLALLLDDPDLGAAAEAVLQPCQHLWISIQIFVNGPALWALGACAATQGRYDEADQLFERADGLLAEHGLQLHREVFAYYHALSLSRSESAAHLQRARELAETGAQKATAAGQDQLAERFNQLLAAIPAG